MKIIQNILLITISILEFCSIAKGFANKTHKAISENAVLNSQADAYLKNELDFSQGLGASLLLDQAMIPAGERIPMAQLETRINPELPANPCSILNFLKAGANLEDVPNPRARHHFHAPIANPDVTPPNPNSGLDNRTDHPDLAATIDGITHFWYTLHFDLTGASAEKRALGTEGAEWETEYQNYYAWPDTRTYFYRALTKSTLAGRNHYLALTFISLGHTAHLLEDMGVPAHTRNDFVYGHMRLRGWNVFTDWGNPLEKWTEDQVKANNDSVPSSWLSGWTPQAKVFDKISKYWDTDLYTGQYVGATPTSTWGLSEQTNYQLLSTSTVFGCDGTLYQFPNPAELYAPIVTEANKRYFSGYGVQHLARETYTNYVAAQYGPFVVTAAKKTITPDDDVNVYNDYVRVTIPRTIDYATGLINYFFRGKLEIEPNCLECETVTFFISNISDNSGVAQTLKGGTFELFWDDRDGNRIKVDDFTIPGWTASSELDYDQQVTGTFSRPDSDSIETYTVVYKGQINENPDEPDNDDDEAIAVATLRMGYPIIAWGQDNYGQVSNVPEGNDFVDVAAGKYHGLAIRSSGSLAAWGSNSYGKCDVPDGNDFTAIAGGVNHSIALKSDGSIVGWGDDSLGQTDVPAGNDFVAIASGDYHNLAITTEGLIVGWGGWNTYGECDAPEPDEGTVYVAVSAGRYHSLALQSDGMIKAWGSNEMGQTRIYAGAGNDHEAIAAADTYNFLLLTDDMLVAWGGGDWLEPGMPDYHYRQPDENDFVAIAAGGYHIVALTNDGRILSWGWNDYDPPPYPVPEGITFTRDLAAGWKFAVALKSR